MPLSPPLSPPLLSHNTIGTWHKLAVFALLHPSSSSSSSLPE